MRLHHGASHSTKHHDHDDVSIAETSNVTRLIDTIGILEQWRTYTNTPCSLVFIHRKDEILESLKTRRVPALHHRLLHSLQMEPVWLEWLLVDRPSPTQTTHFMLLNG
jgi:hypothetical protein